MQNRQTRKQIGSNFRAQMDRDTTEVCLVCLLESKGKIGLEGNKMKIQKDAFLTRVA